MYFFNDFLNAHMPLTGYSAKAVDGIKKSKNSANECYKLKFPSRDIDDVSYRLTCPLDLKYDLLVKSKDIAKSGSLTNKEVQLVSVFIILISFF